MTKYLIGVIFLMTVCGIYAQGVLTGNEDGCQAAYKSCIASGSLKIVCGTQLSDCREAQRASKGYGEEETKESSAIYNSPRDWDEPYPD